MEKLGELYKFEQDGKPDAGHTVVRFVTSWATDETAVERFAADLRRLASGAE